MTLIYLLLSCAGEGLPDVHLLLDHFKDAFDWVEANNSGRIIPREGADSEYDSACKMVDDTESSLLQHLKEQRKLLRENSVRSLKTSLVFNRLMVYLINVQMLSFGCFRLLT